MPDEPNVTFVGGHAIEQTEGLDSNLEPDERETAVEAVRKAIKEAGESSAENAKTRKADDPFRPEGAKSDKDSEKKGESDTPERGSDGKFLPKTGSAKVADKPGAKDTAEVEEALDLDKASVKQLLKQREKVAAMKRDAKDEISKERQEFQRMQSEHQAQVQQFQQAQAQLKRQYQSLQALKADPARAIRELGMEPEQYILDLAQEGTPEGIQKRQYRELQAQIEEMKQWKVDQARQAQQAQEQAYTHQIVQARQHAVKTFTDLAMNEEKYPHVANFYEGQHKALVAFGDLAAEEYRGLSGGKEGSFEDILDYIEDQLAEKAKSWYSKRSGQQVKTTASNSEKPKSKGKTLNPEASGERRTLQARSLRDLDGDERLEAARQAVSVALANSQ